MLRGPRDGQRRSITATLGGRPRPEPTLAPPPSVPTPAPLEDTRRRPLRDLRLSVTDKCNFRCPYCMPAEIFGEKYPFLHRDEILTFEEIERLVRLFVGFGVEKLRITGGEPLLRHGLPDLIARLRAVGDEAGVPLDLAMTTNGSLLARWAKDLAAAGLQRATVSLDSLDPDVFHRMNGERFSVDRVLEGIAAAEEAGLGPIKINCVVQRGVNDEGLVDLARRFHGTGHIVRFIEFMDVGTLNEWKRDEVVTGREIVERIGAELPLEPVAPNYTGEVAARWRYVDGGGEIGVITSVSSRSVATARGRDSRRRARWSPACSPRAGSTCAVRCATGRVTRTCGR